MIIFISSISAIVCILTIIRSIILIIKFILKTMIMYTHDGNKEAASENTLMKIIKVTDDPHYNPMKLK